MPKSVDIADFSTSLTRLASALAPAVTGLAAGDWHLPLAQQFLAQTLTVRSLR
jgi:hypothetical protein